MGEWLAAQVRLSCDLISVSKIKTAGKHLSKHAAAPARGLDGVADLLTIRLICMDAFAMEQRSAFVFACLIAMLGLVIGGAANANSRSPNARALPSINRVAQHSCNPNKQKCCLNSDKSLVPPGTRRGPYTCLPNGTWG
jgi:hypothetical protein